MSLPQLGCRVTRACQTSPMFVTQKQCNISSSSWKYKQLGFLAKHWNSLEDLETTLKQALSPERSGLWTRCEWSLSKETQWWAEGNSGRAGHINAQGNTRKDWKCLFDGAIQNSLLWLWTWLDLTSNLLLTTIKSSFIRDEIVSVLFNEAGNNQM